jgi:hypothetical protein
LSRLVLPLPEGRHHDELAPAHLDTDPAQGLDDHGAEAIALAQVAGLKSTREDTANGDHLPACVLERGRGGDLLAAGPFTVTS